MSGNPILDAVEGAEKGAEMARELQFQLVEFSGGRSARRQQTNAPVDLRLCAAEVLPGNPKLVGVEGAEQGAEIQQRLQVNASLMILRVIS